MKNSNIVVAVLLMLGVIIITGCNAGNTAAQAKNGDTVQLNYTGKLADGTVFDSTAAGAPIEFKLGTGEIIPGFEKAVIGMKAGEEKTVTIPANEAYGPHDDNQVMEISRDQLAAGTVPKVGQVLQSKRDDGGVVTAIITKITDTTITIDGNHPLAGKDLTFEIELVAIK